jgi:hypothetical protein
MLVTHHTGKCTYKILRLVFFFSISERVLLHYCMKFIAPSYAAVAFHTPIVVVLIEVICTIAARELVVAIRCAQVYVSVNGLSNEYSLLGNTVWLIVQLVPTNLDGFNFTLMYYSALFYLLKISVYRNMTYNGNTIK